MANNGKHLGKLLDSIMSYPLRPINKWNRKKITAHGHQTNTNLMLQNYWILITSSHVSNSKLSHNISQMQCASIHNNRWRYLSVNKEQIQCCNQNRPKAQGYSNWNPYTISMDKFILASCTGRVNFSSPSCVGCYGNTFLRGVWISFGKVHLMPMLNLDTILYDPSQYQCGSDITSVSFAFNWLRGRGATLTRAAQRYACCVYTEQALTLSDVTTKLLVTWIIVHSLKDGTWPPYMTNYMIIR